jgi:signal transduction histidine kinase
MTNSHTATLPGGPSPRRHPGAANRGSPRRGSRGGRHVVYPTAVTPLEVTTRCRQRISLAVVQGISGTPAPAEGARQIAGVAWRGLVPVAVGPDPSAGPRWRSPGRRWAARAVLGVATVALCTASLASLSDGYGSGLPSHLPATAVVPSQVSVVQVLVQVLVAVAVVAPLLMAIRYPLLGWRIGWLGLLLVPVLHERWWGGLRWGPVQILVLLTVLCLAGIRHERPVLCWLWALTLIPWWLWVGKNGPGLVMVALGSLAFVAMAVAVDRVGSERRARQVLADQAELERARLAVLEQRTRFARELHDVVAHHLSLMAIRAESAPHRLGALPEPVRAEFGSLSGSAREALADMRRLLSVLRSDQPAAHAPQPGLEDLPGLIGAARQAGMTVELSAPPALDQVPPSAGLCAYRIVQEALSNAGRHAAGAPVAVSVGCDAGTVTLQVTNGPGVPAGPRADGHRPGHGLTGMRERVQLLGGSLSAGPAPDGGFAVSATLPLGGSA